MSRIVGDLSRELESMYKSLDSLPILKRYENISYVKPSRNIKQKIRKYIDFDMIQVFIIHNSTKASEWHKDVFDDEATEIVASYPQSTEFLDRIYAPGSVIEFDTEEYHKSSDHYPRIVVRAFRLKNKPKYPTDRWND